MIYLDKARRDFDTAQERYRRAYNEGLNLAERGYDERAQRLLDAANREFDAAKAALATGTQGEPGSCRDALTNPGGIPLVL